jgi:hypothetical protein
LDCLNAAVGLLPYDLMKFAQIYLVVFDFLMSKQILHQLQEAAE